MKPLLPLFIVLALAVAACGSEENSEPAPQPTPPIAGIGAGPGISIDEAIAMNSDEPLLVNGNIWADGEDIYFCDAVLESHPPQCTPSSRLEVVGLKLAEVDGLQRASGIAWTERTQLLGVVADGKITVSENAMA
jgi:hypothetical protein